MGAFCRAVYRSDRPQEKEQRKELGVFNVSESCLSSCLPRMTVTFEICIKNEWHYFKSNRTQILKKTLNFASVSLYRNVYRQLCVLVYQRI